MGGIQFLVDADGNTKAVVIDIEKYADLLEDLFDMLVVRERADEEDIPWEVVRAEIQRELTERDVHADDDISSRHETVPSS